MYIYVCTYVLTYKILIDVMSPFFVSQSPEIKACGGSLLNLILYHSAAAR